MISIEEDIKKNYELLYFINVLIKTLNKEEIINFDEYMDSIKKQSVIKENKRSAEEIQQDFADIIEKERLKNGVNI